MLVSAILPRRLRTGREQSLQTQKAISELMRVSRPAVTQWEKEDGGTVPELDTLVALARLYDVSVDWLLGAGEDSITSARTESELLRLFHAMNASARGQLIRIAQVLADPEDTGRAPAVVPSRPDLERRMG